MAVSEDYRLKRETEKIGHELRTRLQGVIAVSENLLMELDSLPKDKIIEEIGSILYSSLSLSTVVHNLGDYIGEYYFSRKRIAPILEESKNIYTLEAMGASLEIRLNIKDYYNGIEISSHHIQLAFNNLLHNAIKYSFTGYRKSPRSRYVLVEASAGDEYYEISFQNYGIGMLEEEIESGLLFADSYQGKLTLNKFRTGSGKGLYFVAKVIKRHHGKIEVSSKLLTNSTNPIGEPHQNIFKVYLPYVQPRN